MLEYKYLREVYQFLMQNGYVDIMFNLENGVKKNGYINGEIKDFKYIYMNGDFSCFI